MNKVDSALTYPSGRNLGKDKQIQALRIALEIACHQIGEVGDDVQDLMAYYLDQATDEMFGIESDVYHLGCDNYPFCDEYGCGNDEMFGHRD